jgi:hypothetical protein
MGLQNQEVNTYFDKNFCNGVVTGKDRQTSNAKSRVSGWTFYPLLLCYCVTFKKVTVHRGILKSMGWGTVQMRPVTRYK